MLDLGTAVGYLMLDTSNFNKGFATAQNGMNAFLDKSSTATDKLKGLGSAMSAAGGTLTTSVTLPLIGIGTAAMKVGNEFEAQMSRVQAISGATGEELEALNDLAIQLGADTSFSASQAAEGMENLASAGFGVNEIMDAMPGLLDLAASSGADLATATEIAASAIRGFGLEASDAGHVADVFAEAAARTNAQVEDMGEAMKYIAPVAAAMGQSIEMTSAAVGILSDAGIKGSQAGTVLRGALSRLAKPTEQATAAMEEYGLSFYDAEGNMLSLVGIVEQLETGLSGLTQEQRNQALITLFGQESLSGMLALMSRGSGTLDELTKSFEEVDGSAKNMADTMLDNTSGSIEAMMGSIETLGIKLQQVLAPTVQSVVEKLTSMVNALSSMDEDTLKLVVSLAGVAAAVGPLLIVFGKLFTAISTIQTAIAGAGGLSAILTALTGPIGIVIAAVAALALAWATDFGGIQEATFSIIESLRSIIESFLSWLNLLWGAQLDAILDIVKLWWANLQDYWSMILDVISGLFEAFAALFRGDWEGFLNGLLGVFKTILNTLITILDRTITAIIGTIIDLGGQLYVNAKKAFQFIYNAFKEVWNTIVRWFKKAINDPVGTIKGIGSAMYDAGKSIFNSLWNGIKSVWTGISSWVTDKVNWIVDKVTFWDNEASKVSRSSFDGGQSGGGRNIQGSYASGIDYVPRDMTVKVHRGEAIYTQQQSRDLLAEIKNLAKSNNSGGPTTVVIQIGNKTIRKFVVDAANEETMATGQTVLHV